MKETMRKQEGVAEENAHFLPVFVALRIGRGVMFYRCLAA